MVSSVRGGSTVYLERCTNQIPQPRVFKQQTIANEDPIIVAEWEIKEFVWLSRFKEKIPKLYERLLKMLNVEPEDYSAEIEGFHSYYHEDDPKHRCDVRRIFMPIIRCGKYHPYASIKHRRRASARTLERLEFLEKECRKRHVKFDYIIKLELTFPKWVSLRWDDEEINLRIREAVKDFFKILYSSLFPEHHSKFGSVKNDHFWGSFSPLDPHRHVHLTLPNVVYNSNTDMFFRFKPQVDADVVRDCWKEALEKNDLWNEDAKKSPDVYVRYVKFEDRNKVIHRLSYCCRKPIEDMAKNLMLEDFAVGFDDEFAEFLLDYTPRRINLGFMTNLRKFGYSRISSAVKCPICGGDMFLERDEFGEVIVYDRPPPDVPPLYRDRRGKWRSAII